ncbi:tetratricopeptide repeat protein, partial [Desulfosarcina sp.]|uniref:tetratricopeptide repeat protein n=1 Tax=Desulfosarcina sp. TaxID=2027861 RepID=UPI0035672B4C
MNQIIFIITAVLLGYPTIGYSNQDPCRLSFEKGNFEVARIVCGEVASVNPYAQFVLGEISLDSSGHLTPKSMHWFLKAAEKGLVEAQRRLGEISLTGMMGAKNYKEARKWYEMAAMQNDPAS